MSCLEMPRKRGISEPHEASFLVFLALIPQRPRKSRQNPRQELTPTPCTAGVLPQPLTRGMEKIMRMFRESEVRESSMEFKDALRSIQAGIVGPHPDALDEEELIQQGPNLLPRQRNGGSAPTHDSALVGGRHLGVEGCKVVAKEKRIGLQHRAFSFVCVRGPRERKKLPDPSEHPLTLPVDGSVTPRGRRDAETAARPLKRSAVGTLVRLPLQFMHDLMRHLMGDCPDHCMPGIRQNMRLGDPQDPSLALPASETPRATQQPKHRRPQRSPQAVDIQSVPFLSNPAKPCAMKLFKHPVLLPHSATS